MNDLIKILNNPEEHYPGNFDTPQRANALLTGLCQDAANEIAKLQAEVERLKANIALYKMAEDAVTIGLSYNDWPKIGCVNHDCDQCRAVQEPVAQCTNSDTWNCKYCRKTETCEALEDSRNFATPPAPQPVPVKTYHDGKPWPVAPKPWVGLTDEDVAVVLTGDASLANRLDELTPSWVELTRAIEAKLKEKNHDH